MFNYYSLIIGPMTDQQLIDRYTEETLKLKKILRWMLQGKQKHGSQRFPYPTNLEEVYGPRPCDYANTVVMNLCKREIKRRGLHVPSVSLSE